MEPPYSRVLVGGLGPRGSLLLAGGIAIDVARIWQGRNIDKSPRSRHFFETQFEKEGPGMAFQHDSKAALNTGLPGPISIDKTGLSQEQCEKLDSLTDLGKRYAQKLMANPTYTFQSLAAENISSYLVFFDASKSGRLDTSVTCGPRYIVGEILVEMVAEAKALAEEHLPWLDIRLNYGFQIVDVNIEKIPGKCIPTICNLRTKEKTTLAPYDIFIKATGTTWETPVHGLVAEKAFAGIPDPKALLDYFKQVEALDASRNLKPRSTFLIGGISQSAFDYVGILISRTNIVRIDPSTADGFTIDADEAMKYPGLMTFFNRSHQVCIPRHNHKEVVPMGDVVTPEMLLSIQLHKTIDPYQKHLAMARVLTAIRFNKLPEEIEPKLSIPDQLAHLAKENETFAANPEEVTEISFIRSCFVSLMFDTALGPDSVKLRVRLEKRYPLLVRDRWDNTRYMGFNATHKPNMSLAASEQYREASETIMNHIGSTPRLIHLLFTRLERYGVIKWIKGSYDDVSWSPKQHFTLHGRNYDGLIASRILTSKTDELLGSIRAQTKDQGYGEPMFQKGRFQILKSGHRSPVIELGLVGHGELKEGIYSNVQWSDTNSIHGAHQLMPTIAAMVGLTEDMVTRGVPYPLDRMMEFYDRVLPSPTDFDNQVKKIGPHYARIAYFFHLAELVASVFPNGKTFADKMSRAKNKTSQEALYQEIEAMKGSSIEAACAKFRRNLTMDKFDPHTLSTFERAMPDISAVQTGETDQ
ncbi:hypothetical protein ABW20_dc0105896 [Dactylellina cionopaga]|nr:hypothetical protein ABW20_dc0105896 [Dactylellina cionopaga]